MKSDEAFLKKPSNEYSQMIWKITRESFLIPSFLNVVPSL